MLRGQYKREPVSMTRVERDQAAMTWQEIGLALGFKHSNARRNAFVIYKKAMKKIRSRPEALRRFRELVEFAAAQRRQPPALPEWD